ncbi:pyridoxal-dependent decarboxylase [Ochromonadaceae sp. CCMP2298]|nr:pyridoxal-dependent decarboxylase [Ochromonadaceae sp. CCMP2298]|mmetsp:Transcript_22130/g.50105  ORF Transcript_22130/g.50105 Transcript_22130/m.50105 type:complete len:490 (-) Transcript_22130:235-1704(-)|eukprot:CAMPEP_0173180970 /NCGR_PEP_ID=MMETSP1141-20130122/7020_1 /TAXON_ID=483371 /ORGANISM="non described non described, Strain CCMP2298" /LENGTH=489 /DNA_ID=CAMNT_0014103897 /DNA_START=200 /DNA_END=1669 /DNA_ORIENTATION=+
MSAFDISTPKARYGEAHVSSQSLQSLSSHNSDLDFGCFTDGESLASSKAPTPTLEAGAAKSHQYDVDLHGLFNDFTIHNLGEYGSAADFYAAQIQQGLSASFLVTNLAPIVGQYQQWAQELPMVQPFYAVKCMPDPVALRLLACLGCGFDCATQGEMQMALEVLGGQTERVVFSHPAKMVAHASFALANGVTTTVFDGEDELYKLASLPGHEHFQLLLRLTTDDEHSICRFSNKFGAPVGEAPRLLAIAQSLGLTVAGVSFHVGSGCGDGNAYITALQHALLVFDAAVQLQMPPLHVVDIGGGFPGDCGGYGGPGMPSFQELAAHIREGISIFHEGLGQVGRPIESVRFIAEPGRYFVSASTSVVTRVISRKGGGNPYQALYCDDGVYGSFNNIIYDHATPIPQTLKALTCPAPKKGQQAGELGPLIPSAVFGPTCDGLDQMCTLENTLLPRCETGDWLVWDNMGAYTHTASFVFNGYTHVPNRLYCMD